MSVQRLDESASGVFIISATPFTDNGELDLDSADRLTDFYIDRDVSGITVLGMMGEAQKLSPAEAEQFVARMLQRVDGRVPVIVGVSNAGLDNLQRLSDVAMATSCCGRNPTIPACPGDSRRNWIPPAISVSGWSCEPAAHHLINPDERNVCDDYFSESP